MLVAHDPVPPELLAQLLEQPSALIEQLVRRAGRRVHRAGRGFELARVAGGYRYQTHADLTPYVERFLLHDQRARLSGAALETLAIVAYKQPISRAQVASIRGVDPDGVIRTLQARGYIDEVGRDTRPGPGGAVRHDRRSSSRSSGSTRSTTCRRSPSSSPAPTSSRRSSTACGSRRCPCRGPMAPNRLTGSSRRSGSSGQRPTRAAAAGRAAAEGARLDRVGEPAGLRGADRRRAGHRQR